MKRGIFVSFEGIDGSGKSTQARMLAAQLTAQGREVVLTREPGGSPGAEEIRKLVLEGDPDRWSAETELLLFTAARRDHLERTIRPALARGAIVICDRFADSTRAYQGRDDGGLADLIDRLHALVIGIEPDLTLLIDMDPATALARAEDRGGDEQRFEEFGLALQEAVRGVFLDLAQTHPTRFRVVDGARDAAEIQSDVIAAFDAFSARAPRATPAAQTADPAGRAP